MPQSTTAANGINSAVRIDDTAGLLTDISGTGNNWDLSLDNLTGQAFTFAGKWPITLDGKKNATLTLKVVFSPTASEGADLLRDWFNNEGNRTVQIDHPDGSVGSERLVGEFKLDDLAYSGSAEDGVPMMYEATLLPSGTLTLTTIAS